MTGTWVNGETFDAAYWGRNLREPFLFARGIGVLLGDGVNGGIRACIEISPDAVLSSSIGQCARQAGQPSLPILSSMRRATDEPLHLFEQIARLYELGESLQWRGIHRSRRHASLPTYPWQRQRFWFDQLTPAEPRRVDATNGAHAGRAWRHARPTGARRAHEWHRRERANAARTGATHAHWTRGAHPLLGEAIEPASSGGAERVCLWQFEMDATRPGMDGGSQGAGRRDGPRRGDARNGDGRGATGVARRRPSRANAGLIAEANAARTLALA